MPPTGDLAWNPGMCPDWELIQQPFGSQAGTQSTETHQPGLNLFVFYKSFILSVVFVELLLCKPLLETQQWTKQMKPLPSWSLLSSGGYGKMHQKANKHVRLVQWRKIKRVMGKGITWQRAVILCQCSGMICDYTGSEQTRGRTFQEEGTASAKVLRPIAVVARGRCWVEVHWACSCAEGEVQVGREKGNGW